MLSGRGRDAYSSQARRVMRLEPVMAGLLFISAATAATNPSSVTFTKDVAPVLQKNCQGCHRPGEAAPFSLLTYEQARPWAKAMKEAVLLKKMPPWFADPHYGKFSNDRSLSQKEIDTLVAWSDAGAPQGDPKDMPPPASFVEGWRIPKPDVVFEMPNTFEIPAAGTVEYQYIVVPTGFTRIDGCSLPRRARATARWCITSSLLSGSRTPNG